MNNIREQILDLIRVKLGDDFIIGNVILTKNEFTVETQNGMLTEVKEVVPAMPVLFDGTVVQVSNVFLVNFGLTFEFFVKEHLAEQVLDTLYNLVETEFTRKRETIGTLSAILNSNLPEVRRTEVFNDSKVVVLSFPLSITVGDSVNFNTDVKIEIREQGVGNFIQLPVFDGSVSVSTELQTAQIIGQSRAKAVGKERVWACGADLYFVNSAMADEFLKFLRTVSDTNKLFDLRITYNETNIDDRVVILSEITTPLVPNGLRTFSVGFAEAHEVLL